MTNQLQLVDAPGWGPQARALLADNRTDGWRFDLLDKDNKVLRQLRGIRDFEVRFNLNATIRSGGSCVHESATDVDWTRHRIRAWQTVTGAGRYVEWPVGTFIVKAPRREYTSAQVAPRSLQLFDMMLRLQEQTSTAVEWVAHKGSNVIDTVRYLLDRQGIAHAFEDSDAVFGSTMSWEVGTSYLRMVNDMLDVANFFSCWADPMGIIRSGPYRSPQYRGVDVVFSDVDGDGTMPFLPDFPHEEDLSDVPSQLNLVFPSDDPDELPAVGTYRDTSTRFSEWVTGREITATEEATGDSGTQAERDARAKARLERRQQVAETFEIQHPTMPMSLNGVARLERTARAVAASTVIEGFTYSQADGHLSTTSLRRIQP